MKFPLQWCHKPNLQQARTLIHVTAASCTQDCQHVTCRMKLLQHVAHNALHQVADRARINVRRVWSRGGTGIYGGVPMGATVHPMSSLQTPYVLNLTIPTLCGAHGYTSHTALAIIVPKLWINAQGDPPASVKLAKVNGKVTDLILEALVNFWLKS